MRAAAAAAHVGCTSGSGSIMTTNSNDIIILSIGVNDNDAAADSRRVSSGAVNQGKEPEGTVDLKVAGMISFVPLRLLAVPKRTYVP